MPSHKHKHERSRSHSRQHARDDASSPPSSPPESRSRRSSRRHNLFNDDKHYKTSRTEDKHRSRRRHYSSEGSEESYPSRRRSPREDERERSRYNRRSHGGRESFAQAALLVTLNDQLAQLNSSIQRNGHQSSNAGFMAQAPLPPLPPKAEAPTGLVRTPIEEEEDEDWEEINEEADAILADLEDDMRELLAKVPDSTTQLKDLPPMFESLIAVFNGLAIGQQTDIWLKTHRESREKIAQLLADGLGKAQVIQAKAAEEIAKIAPAEAEKRRLVAEAREDFARILEAQNTQLASLRKDLDRIEAKASKEVMKLPTEDDIKKAAKRDAYRKMVEKLGYQ